MVSLFIDSSKPNRYDSKIRVTIPKGASVEKVLNIVVEKGLITHKSFFCLLYKIGFFPSFPKYGDYLIKGSVSPLEIGFLLSKGGGIRFLVKEGDTVFDIAKRLSDEGIVDKEEFLKLAFSKDFVSSLGIVGDSVEGYLFPDTYLLSSQMSAREIIEEMVKHFWEVYEKYEMAADLKGLSVKEVVTLASMIEKEAAKREEKPVISAVFWNRLRLGMKLQCDPTAVYGDYPKRPPTKKDLLRKNMYNTYFVYGLPKGPISNPGEDSIKAAIFPADVGYLYFVSKGDGTHIFSLDFESHKKAINAFRKRKSF